MRATPARELHDKIAFLDLRAQATAAALVQICIELQKAGVLDQGAIGRVKETVAHEVALCHSRRPYQAEFEDTMRRLDEIFAGRTALERSSDL